MRAFRITEISAVDRPAQEGATMALMKRTDREREIDAMRALMDRKPSAAERELARLRAEADRLQTEIGLALEADEAEAELPRARDEVAALRAELARLTA